MNKSKVFQGLSKSFLHTLHDLEIPPCNLFRLIQWIDLEIMFLIILKRFRGILLSRFTTDNFKRTWFRDISESNHSVSFRVVTWGGGGVGSREGRTPNVDVKFVDDLFLLISPIFSYFQPVTTPPFVYIFSSSLNSLFPSSRPPTNAKKNFFSPLRPRGDRPNAKPPPPQKKIFFVTFPRGPNCSPGGGKAPPPGECLNETLRVRVCMQDERAIY
jgi:hypothetical protein